MYVVSRGASELDQFYAVCTYPLHTTSTLIPGVKDNNKLVQEQHEIPGSRGEANFVWKCKLCQVLPLAPAERFAGVTDKPENTLCHCDSRPERLRSRRKAQRSEDHRSRLSRVGIYRIQAGCTFLRLPLYHTVPAKQGQQGT